MQGKKMKVYYTMVKLVNLIFKGSTLQFIVKVQTHCSRALNCPYLSFCYPD